MSATKVPVTENVSALIASTQLSRASSRSSAGIAVHVEMTAQGRRNCLWRLKALLPAIITGLALLSFTGCGGANGSSAASTSTGTTTTTTTGTTTTGTTSAAPAGYTIVTQPYVSFAYPSGWKLTQDTSATAPYIDVQDPAQPTKSRIVVQFVPGYPNNSSTLDGQCASAIQALNSVYSGTFLPLVTDPTKYPRTTVTWQYLPAAGGKLGGATGTVSVSNQSSVSSSVNYLVDLEAAPRTGGLYITAFWGGEFYYTPPYVEQTFYSNLHLVYPLLPKGSNCSMFS